MTAFAEHDSVAEVLGRGETKCSVRLREGLQVDLRLVPEASFGAALLYFTGSKEHNIELRKIAIERGWSLNEYGLTKGERVVAARTEEEIYRALGLAWIPPELREARGEIELAAASRLPRLIEVADLRADLHMHTTRSDGRDDLDAMIARGEGARLRLRGHHRALQGARHGERLRRARACASRWRRSRPRASATPASRCCTGSRWTSSATARSTWTTRRWRCSTG